MSTAGDQLRIVYNGTNIGKIYLSDIGKRYGLGGDMEGDYTSGTGQDRFIIWGETVILNKSGTVLRSWASGVLKFFSTAASSTSFINGAPLTINDGTYTSADEIPRKDIGVTSGSRFSDAYLAILANDKYAPTGAAGATGAYVGSTF
jgi:hypothetical protein